MCKGVAYGINLLENGGLFYKIQPKMCVQWWSLLGRSRCFHSFIQDLLEDVSFCSSWLDLGEECGNKFLLVHTDYRMYFLVFKYTYHCTTVYLASPSSGLKTNALATCQLQVRNIKTKTPRLQSSITQQFSPSLRPSSRKLH